MGGRNIYTTRKQQHGGGLLKRRQCGIDIRCPMHNLNLGDIKLRHALGVANGGFPIGIPIEKHPHLGHGVGQRLFSHGGEQIHGDQVIRPEPHHRKR